MRGQVERLVMALPARVSQPQWLSHTRPIASEVLLYSKTKLISLNVFHPTRYVSDGSENNEMLVTRNRVWQCRDQTLETKVSGTYDNHLHSHSIDKGKAFRESRVRWMTGETNLIQSSSSSQSSSIAMSEGAGLIR
jgi:hypothetical protein